MSKASKLVQIDYIVSCIENGEQRGEILVKAGKKWGISKSAFDRLLKIAKERHAAKQRALKDKLDAIDTAAAIEARKKAIMTSEERKELLTKIAKGELRIKKPFVIGGKIVEYMSAPDATDRKNAIAELNKMDGSYAPAKVAKTNSAGEDVRPPLTDSQVDRLLSAIKSRK